MKNNSRRFIAILLTLAMVISTFPTSVYAAPNKELSSDISVKDTMEEAKLGGKTESFLEAARILGELYESPDDNDDSNDLTVENDSMMMMAQEELDSEETVSGLTQEQKDNILAAYGEYQKFFQDNADYFGVQTPYFTTKDTNASPIGSLLSIANIPQVAIDAGQVSYEQVLGVIQLFSLSNQFGVQMLGDQLKAAKDKAMAQLSNDMSTVEKLLTLNDWIAQWCQFDMAYIMELEAAEEDTESLEYQMEQQIYQIMYDQIRSQVYDEVYKQVYDSCIAKGAPEDYAKSEAEKVANSEADNYMNNPTEDGSANGSESAATVAVSIINSWKGNHFGALVFQNAVCLGYANAYTYLVQWAFPKIYTDGNGNWKSYEEMNYVKDENGDFLVDENNNKKWTEDAAAMVDYVRINFDAEVSMFGQKQDNFTSEHYWNAVKVDGKYYYVDVCYTDIYIECMDRTRVETDGNMNHLYFMFSDESCRRMYEDNYKDIVTLYEGIANDKTYEDAWFAFAKSPIYSDGNDNWYYFYDSTDIFDLLGKIDSGDMSDMGDFNFDEDTEYKIVYHDGSLADADDTFNTLVDINGGKIYVPAADDSTGEMVDNEMLKSLYEDHKEYLEKYPSIGISCAYADGMVYFNIANCVLGYNVSEGTLEKVLEYNEVSAERDMTVALGGMAFTRTKNDSEADITVNNNPIASISINPEDGNMHVSVATNYAFISGKDRDDMNDPTSYGYLFEETNYNPSYSIYGSFTEEEEINDNDEFMWSANIVETIDMDHLTGAGHTYEKDTIPATCDEDERTISRCSECGRVENVPDEEEKPQPEEVVNTEEDKENLEVTADTTEDTGESGEVTEGGESGGTTEGEGETEPGTEESESDVAKLTIKVYDSSIGEIDETTEVLGSKTITSEEGKVGEKHTFTSEVIKEAAQGINIGDYTIIEEENSYEAKEVEFGKEETLVLNAKKNVHGHGHSYCKFDEIYYTKDNNDKWNTGTVYVCLDCKDVIEASNDEDAKASFGERDHLTDIKLSGTYHEHWNWATDYSAASLYMVDSNFAHIMLDCVWDNDDISSYHIADNITETITGDCKSGLTYTYTAVAVISDSESKSNTKTITVEGKDHSYIETWSWSDDNSSATLTLDCSDCKDKQTVEAEVTEKVTEPTCIKEGSTTYSAKATVDGKEYYDSKTETGEPALGHDYKSFKSNGNGTHTGYCSRCEEEVTENCTYENNKCTICGYEVFDTVITLKAKTADYTGEAIEIDEAEVGGSKGTVTYTYYVDTDCRHKTTKDNSGASKDGSAPVEPGVYYVIASVEEDGQYKAAESAAAKLTIRPNATEKITVTNAASGVTIKWSKVPEADGYRVYRKSGSGYYKTITIIKDVDTLSYIDKDAKSGTTYTYTVRAITDSLEEVLGSYDKAGKTIERLSQPTPVLSNTSTGVKISWDKVAGADGYYVYRKNSSGKWSRIATISSGSTLSCTDKNVKSGTKYSYTLKAYSGSYLGSYHSGKTIERLSQPTPVLSNTSTGVKISWDKVAGADGYYVYRKNSSGKWSRIAIIESGSTLSCTDKNVKSGTKYSYTLKAYSGSYLGSYHSGKTIERLSQPTPVLSNTSTGVKISWDKVTGADGYYVYRKNSSGKWSRIAIIESGSTLSYTDKNVKSGTKYSYTLKAYSGSYLGSYHSGKTIERLSQPTPVLSNTSSGIKISWSKVSGADGYRVYRKNSEGEWVRIATIKSGSTVSYTDKSSSLKSGKKYTYTVKAYSGDYVGSYHSGKTIERLSQPTPKLSNTSSGIKISWNKVSGADGYRVYRKNSEGEWVRIATIQGGSTVSYTDKSSSLKSGRKYTYTVRAYSGDYLSSYHSGKTIERLSQPTITLSKTSSGIKISWSKVSGADGYRVYRKNSEGEWVRIATIKGGSTVSYTDKSSSLKKGKKYTYTVRAYSGDYLSSYHSGKTITR